MSNNSSNENRQIATELLQEIITAADTGSALVLGPQAVQNLRAFVSDILKAALPVETSFPPLMCLSPDGRIEVAGVETRDGAQYEHVGNVFATDAEGDVLVDWDSEKRKPEPGTILFVRLWTQQELDEADREASALKASVDTNTPRGGLSSEGTRDGEQSTEETGKDRPAAPISIGDPCPYCASGRIGQSGMFLRCANCGWMKDPTLQQNGTVKP